MTAVYRITNFFNSYLKNLTTNNFNVMGLKIRKSKHHIKYDFQKFLFKMTKTNESIVKGQILENEFYINEYFVRFL